MSYEIKQVIVIRKDLKMGRGKEIAQGSHASMSFITRKLGGLERTQHGTRSAIIEISELEAAWICGSFAKVCLQCESLEQLHAVAEACREAGIACHVITDAGATNAGNGRGVPTETCLAIGPDVSEKIDAITGPAGKIPLKLY